MSNWLRCQIGAGVTLSSNPTVLVKMKRNDIEFVAARRSRHCTVACIMNVCGYFMCTSLLPYTTILRNSHFYSFHSDHIKDQNYGASSRSWKVLSSYHWNTQKWDKKKKIQSCKSMMKMLVEVMMIVVCWTILFAGWSGLVAECRPAPARFSQFTRLTTTTYIHHYDILSIWSFKTARSQTN